MSWPAGEKAEPGGRKPEGMASDWGQGGSLGLPHGKRSLEQNPEIPGNCQNHILGGGWGKGEAEIPLYFGGDESSRAILAWQRGSFEA